MELLRSHVYCMSSSVFYFTEPTTVILKKKIRYGKELSQQNIATVLFPISWQRAKLCSN